jgi:hypothetical protein
MEPGFRRFPNVLNLTHTVPILVLLPLPSLTYYCKSIIGDMFIVKSYISAGEISLCDHFGLVIDISIANFGHVSHNNTHSWAA